MGLGVLGAGAFSLCVGSECWRIVTEKLKGFVCSW